MNPSEPPLNPQIQEENPEESAPDPRGNSMDDFYRLKQDLFVWTLAMSGFIFAGVWLNYSLNTALNYLLGACVGVVYLRMLAKNVESLGAGGSRFSSNRLALFAGLIIVATQWQQLHIVPVFLGFLTYKAAIIAYTFQTTFSEFMKK